MEVRGQFVEFFSFPLPCGSVGLNSGTQACQQTTLPAEPSRRPRSDFLLFVDSISLCPYSARIALRSHQVWHQSLLKVGDIAQ